MINKRISFIKGKISECQRIISEIGYNDPFRKIKVNSMRNRISHYQEELDEINIQNLRNWIG